MVLFTTDKEGWAFVSLTIHIMLVNNLERVIIHETSYHKSALVKNIFGGLH